MWLSYRSGGGEKYRIEHTSGDNGLEWQLDLAGFKVDVTPARRDRDMVEYPFVFTHDAFKYLLYNRN